ncbi:uncharacterized protein si:ch211-12e13.1 isoform X1 [Acanthochromis polyacanthus]|uniref:uncharacterized protein si:ch211-12e13.1 isoform X1 n=1 Tax=Acanthochromis polyacanthus TaxID=80966 RepID=UPI0022347B4E|nr:uncharacterized protein si:ch211-12e13.1 isoform X1 [Acanthochromis polyacanthus]
MGNRPSYIVAPLSVCSLYLFYVHIYCAHRRLKANAVSSDKLPSVVYLYLRYCTRVLTRRTGRLNESAAAHRSDLVYTILNCRLETLLLRRFCRAAGYGWDYPDTEYRDIPLCFPEFLCGRLLLMLLTDENFGLNPAGLVRVRQSLKTFEPVDELKKGPFMLQAQVLSYQQTDAGVEVDVCLSATSRSGCPVWESVLTLLSENKLHKASTHLPRNDSKNEQRFGDFCSKLFAFLHQEKYYCLPLKVATLHLLFTLITITYMGFFVLAGHPPDEPENVKQVELRVPRTVELRCPWSFSDYSPRRLLSLPARFFGYRSQATPSLWMLSVCLAEIEKHKGVDIITAPVSISVQFKEPLLVPGKVTISFWEEVKDGAQSSARGLNFHMEEQAGSMSHILGLISRS